MGNFAASQNDVTGRFGEEKRARTTYTSSISARRGAESCTFAPPADASATKLLFEFPLLQQASTTARQVMNLRLFAILHRVPIETPMDLSLRGPRGLTDGAHPRRRFQPSRIIPCAPAPPTGPAPVRRHSSQARAWLPYRVEVVKYKTSDFTRSDEHDWTFSNGARSALLAITSTRS